MKNHKINIKETTSSSGSRGSYSSPLVPGVREFDDVNLEPFTIPVSKYNNAMLEYDSYDGKMSTPKKKIKKIEAKSKKMSDYIKKHPELNDDDGGVVNQFPNKNKKGIVPVNEWVDVDDIIIESTNSDGSSGEYSGPLELGLKKWDKTHLSPFDIVVKDELNKIIKQKSLKNNHKRVVGVWEKGSDGTYDIPTHDVHTIKEDLAVWFGTKKKPKGSSQPKGPWVNICRKVDGKHPPCGRPEAKSDSYPKCRAAGVAGKMSDSQKRSACQQKRKAEKTHDKSGTGNKPKMVSYKKKPTNESIERLINRILKDIL